MVKGKGKGASAQAVAGGVSTDGVAGVAAADEDTADWGGDGVDVDVGVPSAAACNGTCLAAQFARTLALSSWECGCATLV